MDEKDRILRELNFIKGNESQLVNYIFDLL